MTIDETIEDCATPKYPKGIYNLNGKCCYSLRYDHEHNPKDLCLNLDYLNGEYICNNDN